MEKKRDKAKHEAKVASLAASEVGYAKARAEEDLAKVQEALAVAKEGRRKWRLRLPSWRLSGHLSC